MPSFSLKIQLGHDKGRVLNKSSPNSFPSSATESLVSVNQVHKQLEEQLAGERRGFESRME